MGWWFLLLLIIILYIKGEAEVINDRLKKLEERDNDETRNKDE